MIFDNSLLIKRLLYQSKYRGCRESEIILTRFALNNLKNFTLIELQEYEEIITHLDADLLDWLLNKKPAPKQLQHNNVFKKLYEYCQ